MRSIFFFFFYTENLKQTKQTNNLSATADMINFIPFKEEKAQMMLTNRTHINKIDEFLWTVENIGGGNNLVSPRHTNQRKVVEINVPFVLYNGLYSDCWGIKKIVQQTMCLCTVCVCFFF